MLANLENKSQIKKLVRAKHSKKVVSKVLGGLPKPVLTLKRPDSCFVKSMSKLICKTDK